NYDSLGADLILSAGTGRLPQNFYFQEANLTQYRLPHSCKAERQRASLSALRFRVLSAKPSVPFAALREINRA
ncbi:MAG: hypothetical protein K2N48_00785, partial [Muribaculaceae bacterium]|nr:hypothetical protein [Muribaculaceae bacterium]